MIAGVGLVVIHTVAAPPAVATFSGTRPALGLPTDSDPFVIDMGTQVNIAISANVFVQSLESWAR